MNGILWKTFYLIPMTLVMFSISTPILARPAIYDVISKGSRWRLNVDGEVGNLEILGGKGSRTADGGWEMEMDVEWQGYPGKLKGSSDASNRQQEVIIEVKTRRGIKIACRGYIPHFTDKFMAGITHPDTSFKGSWYAIKRRK